MDREQAKKIMELYGRPRLKSPNGTVISFARQDMKDVEEIEDLPDNELVEQWKGLVWMNHIYGQVSLNEMQRIQLIELEIDTRENIDSDELRDWFEKAEQKFEENEINQ